MKRSALAVLSALALAFGALLTVAPVGTAHASDKFKAALANADGGSTYIATIATNVSYTLQCTAPGCYATSTSNQTASNCTAHDYVLAPRAQGTLTTTGAFLNVDAGTAGGALVYSTTSTTANQLGTRQVFEREFDSTADSVVLAQGLDGGDPGCVIMQKTVNASSLR